MQDFVELEQILGSVHRDDWSAFFEISDQSRPRTEDSWRAVAERLGGGRRSYTAADLARTHAAACRYFDEPADATNLLHRAVYEFALSEEAIRRLPFLNLGYHPAADENVGTIVLSDGFERFQCNLNLYAQALGAVRLGGRDVVEIGSGRGGGAFALARHHEPRSYVAIDGCRKQVEICRGLYPLVEFMYGNACALPLPDGSADVVLNVESSHCYSDLGAFIAEVRRVLRPGGLFCLTDIVYEKARIARYFELLHQNFQVQRQVDVTANVVGCLEAHGEAQFLNWIASLGGKPAHPGQSVSMIASVFLPLDIAPWSNYRMLTSGGSIYLTFACRKTD
jgi:ubiquinone/menaquinone biosynthesis C-methylase UbiE